MFPYIPASKNSIANRKLICGVGINDADYITNTVVNGRREYCPYYMTWRSMLVRCYSDKNHKRKPTYCGCSVSTEWLTFSIFKQWMKLHKWEGKALDKDVIKPNNKLYSPDTCVFISVAINNILNNHKAGRGDYPQGVNLYRRSNKFRAQISVASKRIHLGIFDTPEEASAAYIKAKTNHILEIAKDQSDPRVKKGLMLHAELIRNG